MRRRQWLIFSGRAASIVVTFSQQKPKVQRYLTTYTKDTGQAGQRCSLRLAGWFQKGSLLKLAPHFPSLGIHTGAPNWVCDTDQACQLLLSHCCCFHGAFLGLVICRAQALTSQVQAQAKHWQASEFKQVQVQAGKCDVQCATGLSREFPYFHLLPLHLRWTKLELEWKRHELSIAALRNSVNPVRSHCWARQHQIPPISASRSNPAAGWTSGRPSSNPALLSQPRLSSFPPSDCPLHGLACFHSVDFLSSYATHGLSRTTAQHPRPSTRPRRFQCGFLIPPAHSAFLI